MVNFKSVNGNTSFDPSNLIFGFDSQLVSSSVDYYQQESNFIEQQNKEFIKSRGGFIKLSEEEDKEIKRKQYVDRILDEISAESRSLFELY